MILSFVWIEHVARQVSTNLRIWVIRIGNFPTKLYPAFNLRQYPFCPTLIEKRIVNMIKFWRVAKVRYLAIVYIICNFKTNPVLR